MTTQQMQTSTEYYAAYYRRRRDEASRNAEDCERAGDANGVNHYKMKAHDYEETAKAVERQPSITTI